MPSVIGMIASCDQAILTCIQLQAQTEHLSIQGINLVQQALDLLLGNKTDALTPIFFSVVFLLEFTLAEMLLVNFPLW